MSNYAVYVDGGSGCDYTMACGTALYDLRAKTLPEALLEAEEYLGDPCAERPGMGQGEGRAVSAKVIEIAAVTPVNILAWAARGKAAAANVEKLRQEDKERAELNRLKLKYGG